MLLTVSAVTVCLGQSGCTYMHPAQSLHSHSWSYNPVCDVKSTTVYWRQFSVPRCRKMFKGLTTLHATPFTLWVLNEVPYCHHFMGVGTDIFKRYPALGWFHVWGWSGAREGRSSLQSSFILFKTVFSYILAQFRRHGEVAALTSRPSEQGEVNLERRMTKPPPSSLAPFTGANKAPSSLVTARTHTHTHKNSHTHYPVTILSQMHLLDRPESPNYTAKPSVRPSVFKLCSPLLDFSSNPPQVQNPRLLSSICQIKLTQKKKKKKDMTNMVQMFHLITFVKQNKYK